MHVKRLFRPLMWVGNSRALPSVFLYIEYFCLTKIRQLFSWSVLWLFWLLEICAGFILNSHLIGIMLYGEFYLLGLILWMPSICIITCLNVYLQYMLIKIMPISIQLKILLHNACWLCSKETMYCCIILYNYANVICYTDNEHFLSTCAYCFTYLTYLTGLQSVMSGTGCYIRTDIYSRQNKAVG